MKKTSNNSPVHVIACGVLTADIKHVTQKLGLDVELTPMPGGLHSKPAELKKRLQETIDEISSDENVERIVLGYGVCGRGAVGIEARNVPLVIPRIHDCIALFLGSDASYREQFAKHPGTYYLSAGWVQEKGGHKAPTSMGSDGPKLASENTEELTKSYGAENAEFINNFMDSWKRNYTRAAFIDTGAGGKPERYAEMAEAMARDYGWNAERLSGTHDLLIKTLTATETDEEVLVVPPDWITQFDALRQRLSATPRKQAAETIDEHAGHFSASYSEDTEHGSGIGLGIDAGGTYTDAVLYDLEKEDVLDKAKALTTKWDYSLGIRNALSRLNQSQLAQVRLVAVSTTLATNSIVENLGQRVGLLVMPPYGIRSNASFRHNPMAYIDGRLEIDGTELQPVNEEEVRRIAREMVDKKKVQAFAVGGYASHANQSHELKVKEIIEEETGLSVTCGHDISEGLNFRVRSETAALNARIIPCLRDLIDALKPALHEANVDAPIMIVRSDGSLMGIDAALKRPLETMLSGPAASAAGATRLAGVTSAMVADIGGTTTDTAIITDGEVAMCEEGATIGGWQTHIRALDLRTLGLGGDSWIRHERGEFTIGPRRVTPLAWLASQKPGTEKALEWIEQQIAGFFLTTDEMMLLALSGSVTPPFTPTTDETALIELLKERPYSVREAAVKLNKPHTSFLPLTRLVQYHVILQSCLTPTDLLHISGDLSLWDTAAPKRFLTVLAQLSSSNADTLTTKLLQMFEHDLAIELLERQITETSAETPLSEQPAAMALIRHALNPDVEGYHVAVSLHNPVIGIGAPAAYFVPEAASMLNTKAIIPKHADVANAIGAITGAITLRRRVTISVNEQMLYRLGGVPDSPAFERIEDATDHGIAYLQETLTALARQAGASDPHVEVNTSDSIAASSDGQSIFVGRTLYGHVTGSPSRSL